MPAYDYTCEKCGKASSLTMTITQHDSRKVRCPHCNSTRMRQVIAPFFAQTRKKS
ncbi:MAG: zinc ribbon domain-containing protein [Candidatus Latescibacterota bacterium]